MASSDNDVLIKISADLTELRKGFEDVQKMSGKTAEEVSKKFEKTKAAFAAVGGAAVKAAKLIAGMGVAFAGVTAAVTKFGSDTARELDLAADRLGITATRLRELEAAAASTGVENDRLRDSLKDLSERVADAAIIGGSYEEFLNQIGLKSKELIGIPVDQQFLRVADGLSTLNSEAQQNLVAVNLMGDAGFEMLNLMKGGAGAIEEQVEAWKSLRGEMSELDVERAAVFSKSLGELTEITKDLAMIVAAEVGPALSFVVEQFKTWIVQAGGAGEISASLGSIVEQSMKIAGDAVDAFNLVWNGLKTGIGNLSVWIWSSIRGGVKAFLFLQDKTSQLGEVLGSAFATLGPKIQLIWDGILLGFGKMSGLIAKGLVAMLDKAAIAAGVFNEELATSLINAGGKILRTSGSVHAGLQKDFLEALQKVEAMKDDGGATYGELLKKGEVEGVKLPTD